MSKETSLLLKGIAILMMVFLHLFNTEANVIQYSTPLIFIGSHPLVNLLTRACPPVPFFLLLSGYGLDYMYAKGRVGFTSQVCRLLKLYIAYWLILLIFVSIGSFIRPDDYPGSWQKIVGNVTSYASSYNSETWFLFPYMLLSVTSQYIFRVIDKLGKWKSAFIFCLIYFCTAFYISRYVAVHKSYNDFSTHIVVYLELSFSFVLGAVLHRISVDKGGLKIPVLHGKGWLTALLLSVLVIVKCLSASMALDPFYCIVFTILFIQLNVRGWLARFLGLMGKYSMPIWLTHSFFCYHLFHDFTYSFKYPLLIYAVLLAISLAVSIPILKLSNLISTVIDKRK